MERSRGLFWAVGLVAVLAVGCGGGGGTDELAAQWATLQEAKAALDQKRVAISDLQQQLEAALSVPEDADAEPAEGEAEGGVDVEALQGQISTAEEELVVSTETFATDLVAFLNADAMVEGEPPTERQIAALRMKSDEDMIVASEWIEKGGDYRRAIEIYESALALDPDNAALQAALAEAQSNRFMTEERFALIKKGMTQGEVEEAIGRPIHQNIREYEDRGVTAWFYPTNDAGDAAGVWFEGDDDGNPTVYQVKFEAIQRDAQEAG